MKGLLLAGEEELLERVEGSLVLEQHGGSGLLGLESAGAGGRELRQQGNRMNGLYQVSY